MTMASEITFPLTETLAMRMFAAEMGHTGMTWDQLDNEFGKGEWKRKAAKVLEGWWNPDAPIVIMDLANDVMMVAEEVHGADQNGGDHDG